MQIPIDDGIKSGSDTNLSIICCVVAMTGNALNMRKNNKIRYEISLDEPLNIDYDGNELLIRRIS